MWATVLLVLTVLLIVLVRGNQKPPGLPPGPFALPFIGNALTILFLTPKLAFKKFVEVYGGIVSFKMFGQWTVLVNDPALIKAGLANPDISGRIEINLFRLRDSYITGKKTSPLGIISSNGDTWRSQRRFTLRTLRDLGFGRNALEPFMEEELEELLQLLRRRQGQKMDVGLMFNRSIINVLWAITMGKRYSYDDTKLEELVGKVNKMMQTFNPFHPFFRFPWIRKVFPNLALIKVVESNLADLLEFIGEEMEQYLKAMNGKVDLASYIGAYINELQEMKPAEGDEATFSMHQLRANIMELFLAGSETTSSTLWWAMFLLAKHPEVQRAMQEELDHVVGPNNMPTLSHMDKLSYTRATIYEIQRVSDILPIAIPHKTLDDVTLGGCHLPKGIGVLFNLSNAHHSPKYWKAPDQFRPEHFLTDDGKLYKPDAFLPFGWGKRVCLGESLARLEVFMFLTSLMHRFTWRLSDDPVVWETSTVLSRAPTFTLYADPRHDGKAEE